MQSRKSQQQQKSVIAKSSSSASKSSKGSREKKDTRRLPSLVWWVVLSSIAAFNIFLYWNIILKPFLESNVSAPPKFQVILNGIYVFVCAYRSVFPRIDLERLSFWDTILSSMFLGRTAATFAEVSFAIQLGHLLHQLANYSGFHFIEFFSIVLPVLLTIAQVFCWMSVLSLNHVYHAIEESHWATGGLICAISFGSVLYTSVFGSGITNASTTIFTTNFLIIATVQSMAFFTFMVTVDVPMYLYRWREGKKTNQKYLSFGKGALDALFRRVPSQQWKDWKEEVAWLTGYFSGGVWLSIYMAYVSTLQ